MNALDTMKTILFESYIHKNDCVIVKRCIPEIGLYMDEADLQSPFVKKYLGTILATDFDEATKYFQTLI